MRSCVILSEAKNLKIFQDMRLFTEFTLSSERFFTTLRSVQNDKERRVQSDYFLSIHIPMVFRCLTERLHCLDKVPDRVSGFVQCFLLVVLVSVQVLLAFLNNN